MNEIEILSKKFDLILDLKQNKKQLSFKQSQRLKNLISQKKVSSFKYFENEIEKYYNRVFRCVEAHLDQEKKKEYEEFKISIQNSIFSIPPSFPIAKYVPLTRKIVDSIEKEWQIFEKCILKLDPNFKLKTVPIEISLKIIINKIYSPSIIGCFLGLIIGMSSMREILFSTNHYISNLVESFYLITKTLVICLYITLGISMTSVRHLSFLNTPVNKYYIILIMIIRFLIMPGIGYLYVHLWTKYFGGMVLKSKVFRIAIFMPFSLPPTANIVIIVNIIKFFAQETALFLFANNMTLFASVTIIYLIYSIIVGS
jgi:hypothetical protein